MYKLIIDYGTSSCRASLVDEQGQITASCRKTAVVLQNGNEAVIAPGAAWKTVLSVISELFSANPGVKISAVGVSALLGWVFLDSGNNPLGDCIIWMDSRTDNSLEEKIKESGVDFYRKTGRRFSTELLISKWSWLKSHQPAICAKTARIISLKDEIIRRLSGEIVTDWAHLNYTMFWNIEEHCPDEDLLKLAKFPAELLSEGRYPFEQAGSVTAEAAGLTGIPEGTPVVTGSIDGTTAMYGGGMAKAGAAALVSGTTDVLMMLTDKYIPAIPGCSKALTVNTGMIPGTFAAGGATGTSGGALTKISGLLDGDYLRLLSEAELISPGADGLLFSPGFSGERAPYWNSSITGGFLGLGMNHSGAHLMRAVMEGAAFRLKRLFIEMLGELEIPQRIYILGGCSEIDCWNGIRTDVIGMPLTRPAESEATTLGTAMFCECLISGSEDLAVLSDKLIQPGHEYPVNQDNKKIYDQLFRIYEDFIRMNTGNYAALSAFKGN